MIFASVTNLLAAAEKSGLPMWECILRHSAEESGIDPAASRARMHKCLNAMREADASYDPKQCSRSALVGGQAEKMRLQVEAGRSISGCTASPKAITRSSWAPQRALAWPLSS